MPDQPDGSSIDSNPILLNVCRARSAAQEDAIPPATMLYGLFSP